MIVCSVGEVIIFEHGCYISALESVMMLIFSSYVLEACINPIYKYGHHSCLGDLGDLVRCILYFLGGV